MGCSYIPEPYKSSTASMIEDVLADAIVRHCDANGIEAETLQERYEALQAEQFKFKSQVEKAIQESLGRAIVKHCDEQGLEAKDIQPRYASIRSGHLATLRRGEPLGIKMLTAISEACGLRVFIEVRP
jgi:hypothetical protein